MNIALSAVLISILLIPPVLFYISLYTGKYPRSIPKFSLFEGILASAVLSLFVHALAICIISKEIDFSLIIKLLGGDIKEISLTNAQLYDRFYGFALYNLFLCIAMVILGRIIRKILLHNDLHTNSIFNLYNKWWYLFNGYYPQVEKFDIVYLEAVVDTHAGTMIFAGYLINFECKGGELDRIYLQNTTRRDFKSYSLNDQNHLSNKPGSPIVIPGDTFSIAYANIINLNIRFLILEEEA